MIELKSDLAAFAYLKRSAAKYFSNGRAEEILQDIEAIDELKLKQKLDPEYSLLFDKHIVQFLKVIKQGEGIIKQREEEIKHREEEISEAQAVKVAQKAAEDAINEHKKAEEYFVLLKKLIAQAGKSKIKSIVATDRETAQSFLSDIEKAVRLAKKTALDASVAKERAEEALTEAPENEVVLMWVDKLRELSKKVQELATSASEILILAQEAIENKWY